MLNFQGTWRLKRYEHRRADGLLYFPLGENARGLLIYTPDGYMSGQIMRPEKPRFQGGVLADGSEAEIRAALLGYVAYFGTYTVDENAQTMIHEVIGSWRPNFVGSRQVRHYEFEGPNRLLLRTPPRDSGKETRTGLLVWERAGRSC